MVQMGMAFHGHLGLIGFLTANPHGIDEIKWILILHELQLVGIASINWQFLFPFTCELALSAIIFGHIIEYLKKMF